MGAPRFFGLLFPNFIMFIGYQKNAQEGRTLANLSATGWVMILAGRCPVAQDPGCFLDGIEEDHAENELDEATEF
ncbi:hypothetical protein JCM25156A_30450 [Komagataeibacter kakiaceti JCM 25156]